MSSIYLDIKDKEKYDYSCKYCAGRGRIFNNYNVPPTECDNCQGTGVNFSEDNENDREFFYNLLKVFHQSSDWTRDAKYLRDIVELNPSVFIIDSLDKDHTFTIVFKNHSCYIEDGMLQNFF